MGDDLIACWTKQEIQDYESLMSQIGFVLNANKSFASLNYGVFCESHVYPQGREIIIQPLNKLSEISAARTQHENSTINFPTRMAIIEGLNQIKPENIIIKSLIEKTRRRFSEKRLTQIPVEVGGSGLDKKITTVRDFLLLACRLLDNTPLVRKTEQDTTFLKALKVAVASATKEQKVGSIKVTDFENAARNRFADINRVDNLPRCREHNLREYCAKYKQALARTKEALGIDSMEIGLNQIREKLKSFIANSNYKSASKRWAAFTLDKHKIVTFKTWLRRMKPVTLYMTPKNLEAYEPKSQSLLPMSWKGIDKSVKKPRALEVQYSVKEN